MVGEVFKISTDALIKETQRPSCGEGHGNPLQDSGLENPMDRGAWWAYSPWGRKKPDMTEET